MEGATFVHVPRHYGQASASAISVEADPPSKRLKALNNGTAPPPPTPTPLPRPQEARPPLFRVDGQIDGMNMVDRLDMVALSRALPANTARLSRALAADLLDKHEVVVFEREGYQFERMSTAAACTGISVSVIMAFLCRENGAPENSTELSDATPEIAAPARLTLRDVEAINASLPYGLPFARLTKLGGLLNSYWVKHLESEGRKIELPHVGDILTSNDIVRRFMLNSLIKPAKEYGGTVGPRGAHVTPDDVKAYPTLPEAIESIVHLVAKSRAEERAAAKVLLRDAEAGAINISTLSASGAGVMHTEFAASLTIGAATMTLLFVSPRHEHPEDVEIYLHDSHGGLVPDMAHMVRFSSRLPRDRRAALISRYALSSFEAESASRSPLAHYSLILFSRAVVYPIEYSLLLEKS